MQTNDDVPVNESEKAGTVPAMVSVGDLLREEREKQGLSEKQVADDLHITMHYVRALESNSFDKLPGAVFAKGYIKSYSLLLGLDPSVAINAYDEYQAEQLDAAREKTRIQVRKRKDRNRPWVIMSVLGSVGLFAGLWFINAAVFNQDGSEVVSTAPAAASVSNEIRNLDETVEAIQAIEASEPEANFAVADIVADSSEIEAPLETAEEILESVLDSSLENAETAADLSQIESQDSLTVPDNSAVASTDTQSRVNDLQLPDDIDADLIVDAAQEMDSTIQVEAVGEDLLVVNFSGESWIEISDGFEAQIYRDLREAGDVLEIKGTAPFNILLGDAPFANLLFNGEPVDVAANIRIDNSARLTVGN